MAPAAAGSSPSANPAAMPQPSTPWLMPTKYRLSLIHISKDFRALVRELALFEGYEATRDLALEDVEVRCV